MGVGISIFLTTFNRPEALVLCLDSILSQHVLPDEIIVADDGSGGKTKHVIDTFKEKSSIPVTHCWHEDKGYRLNKIRNMAIRTCSFPYIIQIDGDIILHRDFIKDHKACMKKGRFLAGSRIKLDANFTNQLIAKEVEIQNSAAYPPYRSRIRNGFKNIRYKLKQKIFRNIQGCNLSYWKADAIKVNGYDEEMNSWGPDDKEFAARLKHNGVSLYRLKTLAFAYHLYHPPRKNRDSYSVIKNRLEETLKNKKIFCVQGIVNKKN